MRPVPSHGPPVAVSGRACDSLRGFVPLALVLMIGVSITPGLVYAQTRADSRTAARSSASPGESAADAPPQWLFPVARLDESLPDWVRIGGEYRDRVEDPKGIGDAGTRDSYLLGRLRVHTTVQ